jgi:NADH-quinone oxidoreductase subunit L
MTDYLWLIPLLPLVGAALNGLAGKRLPKSFVSAIACGTACASFIFAIISFFQLLSLAPEQRHIVRAYFTWIESGDFIARAEFLLDPLSAVMILVVTGVGFLIHIYSIGYMHSENGYYRFFSYMNLFLFSMLVLVLSGNFLLMFVGWEGVGLCSYLLIGYYFDRRSAGDAGKKAFIVNRIGDIGFVLGIFLIFLTFNSVNFGEVFLQVAEGSQRFPVETGIGILTAISLLLFVGATGKSAQIPLYVWLPDAMEGPTPVSALIHAATMVTAGVYMVVRCSPFFSRAPLALEVVMVIGIMTSVMAATIGLVQRDIKRVLAYSTVSQLGYMFVAAGVGAFSAGIFHLMTHAFFKALLFLGAGSVIHALGGEQDLMQMGGLRKIAPVTFQTMMVAALAISGIFPLAGFFSKDEILWSAWSHGHPMVWFFGFVTAFLTAFYMFRLVFLTFFGEPRFSEEVRHHAHESPFSMTGPLLALGVLSVIGGFIGVPAWLHLGSNKFFDFLEPSLSLAYRPEYHEFAHVFEFGFAAFSVAAAVAGICLAYRMYVVHPESAEQLSQRLKGIYTLLFRKYYVDELYDAAVVNPTLNTSTELLWKRVDVGIIDGAVNGAGRTIQGFGSVLKGVQNGLIRSYATWILLGAVAIILYISVFRT